MTSPNPALPGKVKKPKPPRVKEATVLFDAPGPRARARIRIFTIISAVALLGFLYLVYWRMDQEGQFAKRLWEPFTQADVWRNLILPALGNTMKAFAIGSVLALVFGVFFGIARLSDHWWISIPAGAVVEFFRAIPLLILIVLLYFVPQQISPLIADSAFGQAQRMAVDYFFTIFGIQIREGVIQMPVLAALVFALMLYNGSVLAEVFRAGIRAVPKGQSEAGYSIGLRKGGVTRFILLPQAVTAMMPAIISQLVVLLKDTSLGFIIAFEDLTNYGTKIIPASFNNIIQAGIVVILIYLAINMTLGYLANALERRSRRSRKSAATTLGTGIGAPPAVGMGAQQTTI